MSSKRLWLGLAACAVVLAARVETRAQQCATCNTGCAPACQTHHCPPALKHCAEGMPNICFKCGCPRPVCCPCDQPNWGYYQTCWRPWPWGMNWSHCPPGTPAAEIPPVSPHMMYGTPQTPTTSNDLKMPKKMLP